MNIRFAESCRSDYLELQNVERKIEFSNADLPPCQTCEQDIYLGFFFDGTNNNKYRDAASFGHSNVARLYEVYPGTPAAQTAPKFSKTAAGEERKAYSDTAFFPSSVPASQKDYFRKVYIAGVGTPFPDVGDAGVGIQKTLGLAMALLGEARLDWAMLQLCNQVHAAIFKAPIAQKVAMPELTKGYRAAKAWQMLDPAFLAVQGALALQKKVEEMSRTAGLAQDAYFEKLLSDYETVLSAALKKRSSNGPALRKIRLSIFGFSRGAAEARVFANRVLARWRGGMCGIALQIDFLGIFDTVASVGVAQSVPHANGHFAWAGGNNMMIQKAVRRCVHLVSAHEVRGSFPLDSVCSGGQLPDNCKEIVYPGVHSDVGGGYPAGDQGRAVKDSLKLSQIPLAQMYREARMAGVPLPPDSDLKKVKYLAQIFEIAPQLLADFNAYVKATRKDTIPPADPKQDAKLASLFPTETQPREDLIPLVRRHYGYLLQWRRKMLNTPGGASGLSGMKNSSRVTKQQDIEDIRGAEVELRKEIAFLWNGDPKKYEVMDDMFLQTVQDYVNKAKFAASVKGPFLATLMTVADWQKSEAIKMAMKEKQKQWDGGLKAVWYGADALPAGKVGAADKLFADYVHDSRAWFKAFMRTDGLGMAPDDEDWFTLGGRSKEKAKRKKALQLELYKQIELGNLNAQKKIEQEIAELEQDGQPLVYGGREPYRLWGYLRHRRIYQTGSPDPAQSQWEKKIAAEELVRLREQIRTERLQAEAAYHQAERERIVLRERAILASAKATSQDIRDAQDGAKFLLESEDRRYDAYCRQINQDAKKV